MLELLIDFDYQTIRQALLAAYIMAIVFPIAACYFFNKQSTLLNDKYQASFEAKQELMPIRFSCFFDCRGAQRFFTTVRRKSGPNDADEPSLLLIV
jgi:hypothetical protein